MKNRLKNKTTRNNFITYGVVILIYIVMQILTASGSISSTMQGLLVPICAYVVMAISLNLTVGILGELSLGHAGFMSVGAFTGVTAAMALSGRVSSGIVCLIVGMVVGAVFAAIVGFLIGIPVLRLKGDYLAIVTLACGEIIKNVITNLDITGGALGLNTAAVYSGAQVLLPYAAALVLITCVVMLNLKRSKYGRAIMAIRDNRIAAESVGLNVTFFKLAVFVIAAFFAGAAGVLYGHSLANVKAAAFDYNMSIEILIIVVLGGMGSVPGSIIAAIVLTVLPEALRGFADYRMLIYAIVLIVVMLATNSPQMKALLSKLVPFGKKGEKEHA